jgi:glycosyltransferase involved in cell wall biosynthesis
MKITIAVRTYNRPHFLKEALVSIQLQTHKDWEVLIFDDAASVENFTIYRNFKDTHDDKNVMYITTKQEYDMFQNSWLLAPDLANGELIVRLDDDDLLAEDALEFLSKVYSENPELDFSYGSSIFFKDNELTKMIETINPFEAPQTTSLWSAYTIPNNHPWLTPWSWTHNYYKVPQNYTSIIHCAKSNIMCIYHPYVMRTSSVKRVKDKITITSKFVDDLEFLGSLDYLGLGHNSLKKIITYVRVHDDGRVTDIGKIVDGTTIFNENFRIRDKVDHLRTSGFLSKVIPLGVPDNFNNGITNELIQSFSSYKQRIFDIVNS